MKLIHIPLLLLALICCPACQNKKAPASKEVPSGATYTNPLLPVGAEPWAVFHEGKYYYTQGAENKIILWETNDITDLEHATRKEVWIPGRRCPARITFGDRKYTGLTENGTYTSPRTTAIWTITTSM